MMMRRNFTVTLTVAVLLAMMMLSGATFAQTLSGRLTTSFYAFQREDSINVSSSHARGYETFQFDFGASNIFLRAYGQLDTDFGTELAGDGKARMFNLYLDWRNIAQRAEIKIGRQSLFGGVAAGTIDGAQVKVQAARWLRLKAFGGGLLPADQRVKISDDFDQNYLAGGQAVFTPVSELNVSLSYLNKRQLRPGYNTQRSDSVGNVFTQFIEPADRAYELAGLDASWTLRQRTYLYARSDYDLIGEQLTRAEFSVKSEVSPVLTLNGSYTFRSPRLPWNSIFSVFNVEDNHEAQLGAYFRYKPALRFYGDVAGIFYSNDNSLRFTVGFDANYGSLNYVHRGGYAGELDGVNAALYYLLHEGRLMPSVQLSWAAYKLDQEQESRQSLFSGAAGLMVRPQKMLTIEGQLQVLHNRYYSNDVRGLFRLQYWFFTKLGATAANAQ